MYGKPSALKNYGRIANSESDPIEQIVMLYNGAIRFLQLAAIDIDAGNIPSKAENTNRALDIVRYLQSILDFERGGSVAESLDSLYTIVTWTIIRASASLQSSEMKHAADLLTPVRDAWTENSRIAKPVSMPLTNGTESSPSMLATA